MISIENLHVEFSARPLYDHVSFVINDRDRIALVGKNGAGKSTLLKIIAGIQQPMDGVVSIPNDTKVGYLPQVMKLSDDTTVRDETRKAFADTIRMGRRLEAMQDEMARRTDYESEDYMQLVEKFTSLHEQYLMLGGEQYEAEMERTLQGLGFVRTDFDRPTSEFSGGWRMRIELAKILLQKPDVLLLDEPTNHLDIESIQWLEQYLAQSSCAVVLVSHDRAFINNVTIRTIEIVCGHIEDYKVKYDEYVVLRKERREQQMRAYENQQKEIADTKAFIERFRYQATKAVQVQQRIRQLEKIVPIEVDEVDTSALRLKFPPCLRSGDYPVICEDVSKTYETAPKSLVPTPKFPVPAPKPCGPARSVQGGTASLHNVFHDVSLIIKRGEKVAFVGKNGEGKSTLVKCIMNEIPYGGTLKIGHNVQIGYFAQNQAQLLDDDLTVFDTIDRVAKGEIRLRINDILGAFMFGGEASEKKVKFLSGGERSRLAMIRLLLEPVNFLILDEPTNHLDMQSKDVLKEAIKAFDGTAIIVSHDREFLDGLVDKVYEFGGGRVREYLGGIYDWIRAHNKTENPDKPEHPAKPDKPAKPATPEYPAKPEHPETPAKPEYPATPVAPETPDKPEHPATPSLLTYAERKERQKQVSRLQKQVNDSEKKISTLEARLAELDTLLCDPKNASDMKLVNEYTDTQASLDREMERWTDLSEKLDTIKL